MTKIFSVPITLHDHNTYDGEFHNQIERYSRVKYNVPRNKNEIDPDNYSLNEKFTKEYFKKQPGSILAFSYSGGGIKKSKDELFNGILNDHKAILDYKPTNLFDYYLKDDIYYIDHHQSHAVYAFLSSGYDESDVLAIDGKGAKFKCIFIDKNKTIFDLTEQLPLGWVWNEMSRLVGFGSLNAGKIMGLAGYGKYSDYYYNALAIMFDSKLIDQPKEFYKVIDLKIHGIEDLAFTLQQFTLDMIKEYIYPLKSCENICIAGGVAYNGYMNEEFTKHYRNVFVPPAVGDEGQSLGVYMHADYTLNKQVNIPSVYAGKEHPLDNLPSDKEPLELKKIAQAIADGKIIGWYQGKSESGNRALGNRSILADPRNPNIKNIINTKIKKREDFRPFAPSVLIEHYQYYFDTNQPSPYMSRIVPVKSDKIPGVTHIDNTARIQTVDRDFNTKFYDLINEFYEITGVPILLNTSFNCQEPIVETPADALKTFYNTELDILVIDDYVIRK